MDPNIPQVHGYLSWLLAAGPGGVRDGKQAVGHATRACELTGSKAPDCIATLAAHAEAGGFDKAVEFQEKALSFPAYAGRVGKAGQERLQLHPEAALPGPGPVARARAPRRDGRRGRSARAVRPGRYGLVESPAGRTYSCCGQLIPRALASFVLGFGCS